MLLVNCCILSPELPSDRSMYKVQDLTPRLYPISGSAEPSCARSLHDVIRKIGSVWNDMELSEAMKRFERSG